MKTNVPLSKEEIELILEALDHLYFETDRAMQYSYADHLPKLKEHFLNKKKNIKNLLKRIK
jgi:hypothetical protein